MSLFLSEIEMFKIIRFKFQRFLLNIVENYIFAGFLLSVNLKNQKLNCLKVILKFT